MPSLDITIPILMSCALLWWVSRGLSWTNRLIVAVLTLALIIVVVLVEQTGLWPEQFRR